jgi:predicted nucleic acid-binding protein
MERGLAVTGVLGVLAEAQERNLVRECRLILDNMIRVAGFGIGDDLRTRYLRGVGETD